LNEWRRRHRWDGSLGWVGWPRSGIQALPSAPGRAERSPNRCGQGRVFASSAGGDMCGSGDRRGGRWGAAADATGRAGLTAVLVPRRAGPCANRYV